MDNEFTAMVLDRAESAGGAANTLATSADGKAVRSYPLVPGIGALERIRPGGAIGRTVVDIP